MARVGSLTGESDAGGRTVNYFFADFFFEDFFAPFFAPLRFLAIERHLLSERNTTRSLHCVKENFSFATLLTVKSSSIKAMSHPRRAPQNASDTRWHASSNAFISRPWIRTIGIIEIAHDRSTDMRLGA